MAALKGRGSGREGPNRGEELAADGASGHRGAASRVATGWRVGGVPAVAARAGAAKARGN